MEQPSRKIVSGHEQHAADGWQSIGVIAKIECSIFIASMEAIYYFVR
jgi:hypothetical protein